MKMKKISKILCGILIVTGATGASAQSVSKQYYVPKAGTLISLMTREEADAVTHLTLTGKINAEDFRHLRDEFANLEFLDLSNVEIKLYSGKAGTYPEKFYIYPGGFIPAYAFCRVENGVAVGKSTLREVVLPNNVKNIEDAAFKGCSNLQICRIKKKTPPNLLPEALADSITAVFVSPGSTDAYKAKTRWESFAFIEGEPVRSSVQVGMMGSLAEEIQKLGIQPRDINFLTVEGKLDAEDFKLIRDYMPNLVSVNLENTTVETLPDFTFTQKKYLLNIALPKRLKVIGERCFSGCGRLCGTVTLPESMTTINYGAFMGCDNLRHVAVTGNKLTALGENIFGEGAGSKLLYKSKE
jgi:hypothetical protein